MKRMQRKHRNGRSVDGMIAVAVEWIGSIERLFDVAAQAAYGHLRKKLDELERIVREALGRYRDRKAVPKWLRRFVFSGNYRKIPRLA